MFKKLRKKGQIGVISSIIALTFTMGITIFAYSTLSSSLNDSTAQTFFTDMTTQLTNTTTIIGAVITIALIAIILVVMRTSGMSNER